ncbi:MAG: dynamin family protein [Paludibacteraceae bacterium]|nr:dynamin family protein [Paludibacteraceae bacterium]
MAQNLFEQLQEKKTRLIAQTRKAKEFGWIDEQRELEIVDKINKDVLTIGVIGQMKCGKSTFLNSFVFEDDVLPAATTPMTAALSVITYGKEKSITAEFYSKDEWEEQKVQASRSLDSVAGNTLEESKIKAAKELVDRASKLGTTLESYLGKTQSDTFEDLIEYVGADGKFVSITKAVTIYYPKEYLKGVEIVDTPGFNDPIVSREERTKAFLKKADVVLLMLYAGRPFDATDRDILFKNVGQCGTGRVLIGINKYDIPFENGETENEIKNYVKEQLEKACKECNDNLLVDVLKFAEPIPLSAEMALLSELPMSKVNSNDAYSFAWKRNCETFEISGQPQMREKSHIDDLINAVKKVVETEKEEILFRKPINSILAAGNKMLADIEKGINENKILINTYSQPDDELEERQSNITKANRRLQKKIESLGDDIEEVLKDIVRKGRNQLEDSVESSCRKMDSIIDDLGRFSSVDSILPALERETQTLVTRTLKRDTETIILQAKTKIKQPITEFLNETEDVLMRFIPDFDSRDFIKSIEKEINFDLDDNDMFSYPNSSDDSDYGFGDLLYNFLNGATWGLLGGLGNAFSHGEVQNKLHKHVNEMRNIDVTGCLETIYDKKDQVIEKVKSRIIEELINPLQEKIDEIVKNKDQKEQKLNEAKLQLEKLLKKKTLIDEQLQEMTSL